MDMTRKEKMKKNMVFSSFTSLRTHKITHLLSNAADS